MFTLGGLPMLVGGLPSGTVPAATVPGQFGDTHWTALDSVTASKIEVTLITIPSNGGAAITDIQYQLDGGSWVTSGLTDTGVFDITSVVADQLYGVSIRAVNSVGNGNAAVSKAVTPTDVTPSPGPEPFTPLTTTQTVTSMSALNSALSAATGGEVIGCTAAVTGNLSRSNTTYASEVIVTSDDNASRATFTHMQLTNMSNIAVVGVDLEYTYLSGQPTYYRPFNVSQSDNVRIEHCTVTGTDGFGTGDVRFDSYGIGEAIYVNLSDDITVSNNTFTGFNRSILAARGDRGVFDHNEMSDTNGEAGVSIVQMYDGTSVQWNYMHDYRGYQGSTDGGGNNNDIHRDGIEYRTDDGTRMDGLNLSNNYIDIGAGAFFQGILGRNTTDSFFNNNTIFNYHLNGIAVDIAGSSINPTVTGNDLHVSRGADYNSDWLDSSPSSGAANRCNIIVKQGWANATVSDNQTPETISNLLPIPAAWTVSNNTVAP